MWHGLEPQLDWEFEFACDVSGPKSQLADPRSELLPLVRYERTVGW